MHRLNRLRAGRDRGAVTVWVAILMVPLLIAAALAVDIAAAHADRQRLQTGADAAALAIAQQCANGGTCTPAAAQAIADELAAANAPVVGDESGVLAVDLDVEDAWVEVTTSTETEHWFAPVMGVDHTDVAARGAASFASVHEGIIPIAVPHCYVDEMPIFGEGDAELAATFYNKFHKTVPEEARDCLSDTGWSVAPGNFGWLKPDPECLEGIEFDDEGAVVSTGNSASCSLSSLMGQRVLIPVYLGTNGANGSNLRLHIVGYIDFTLTGLKLSGGSGEGEVSCSGSERCLEGVVHGWLESVDGGRPPVVAVAELRLPRGGGS